MIKRAWLVVSGVWAAVFLAAGSTREDGLLAGDFAVSLLPFVAGPLLLAAFRFILWGSVRKREFYGGARAGDGVAGRARKVATRPTIVRATGSKDQVNRRPKGSPFVRL